MRPASIRRLAPQRYRLEAAKCSKCGKLHFPPRLICDSCHGREFVKVKLGRKGRVVTYTVVHIGPSQFQDITPYAVAIVELDEGVRLTCQVTDVAPFTASVHGEPQELRSGMRVKLEFRRIQADGESGLIAYAYKAVPDES